jgi:hypothetical protein
MPTVRVFTYIDQLDAFVVTDQYRDLADRLGLTEWNPVVSIGRLFTLDNDYGEHWFDNWSVLDVVSTWAMERLWAQADEDPLRRPSVLGVPVPVANVRSHRGEALLRPGLHLGSRV